MKIRYFEKRGSIWMDFKDATGRRRRVPTGATTQAQAEAAAPRILAAVLAEQPAPAVPQVQPSRTSSMTLQAAFEAARKARWVQAKDLASKASDFEGLLTAPGLSPEADCTMLTRDRLLEARSAWLQAPGKRAGTTLSPSTINHRLSMASVLLEVAGLPPHGVKFLSVLASRRTRRVREEELQGVVQWCLANHHRLGATAMADLVLVGMHTTARLGELLALRWADIYLDKGIAVIVDAKNGSSRTANLNGVAQRVLQGRQRLGGQGPFDGLGKWQACALWRGARKALGLEGDAEFVFHVATRHEGLSRLADAGLSAHEIQQYGGHKSAAASARYVHLSASTMRRAGDVLAGN